MNHRFQPSDMMPAGTPVMDAHIPLAPVHESRDVLGAMGAAVTERIYSRYWIARLRGR